MVIDIFCLHRFRQTNFERKILNIFLPISLTYVLGVQKNHLIETVLLSTHNIYFGLEIGKIMFW